MGVAIARVRAPAMVGLVALLLAGCGGGASPAIAEGDAVNRMSVGQYLRLQARAETDSDAALLLGGYVAGLFTGLTYLNELEPGDGLFCSPPGLEPELRDLLNFLDESLLDYRSGLVDPETVFVQEVLFEALVERFPCGALPAAGDSAVP
jgi:hypothetical protein